MIAHPGRYKFTANEEYALFTEFKAHGGRGVEVVTGSHSAAEYVKYADDGAEFGLPPRAAATSTAPTKATPTSASCPAARPTSTPVWEAAGATASSSPAERPALRDRPRADLSPASR